MVSPRKRREYDGGFNVKVVEFAKNNNNCAAAREFGEKLFRDWRKQEVNCLKRSAPTVEGNRIGQNWRNL